MQVAGKVLSNPKLYRIAVEAAGCRHRAPAALHDVQQAQRLGPPARGAGGAAADLPPVVPQEPEEQDSEQPRRHPGARAQQPAGAADAARRSRRFERTAGRSLDRFEAAVQRMGGKVARPAADGDLAALVARPVSRRQGRLLRDARSRGQPRSLHVRKPADLADVDVGVVRAVFGVAETGSVWLTHREFKVESLGFLAQHLVVLLDPARIVANLARRVPRAGAVRRPLRRIHDRPVGDRGHRGRADPRRAGHSQP